MEKQRLIGMLENPVAEKIVDTLDIRFRPHLVDFNCVVEFDEQTAIERAGRRGYCKMGERDAVFYNHEPGQKPEIHVDKLEDYRSAGLDVEEKFYQELRGVRCKDRIILNEGNLRDGNEFDGVVSSLPNFDDERIRKEFFDVLFRVGVIGKIRRLLGKKYHCPTYVFRDLDKYLRALQISTLWEDLDTFSRVADNYVRNYGMVLEFYDAELGKRSCSGIVAESDFGGKLFYNPTLSHEQHQKLYQESFDESLKTECRKDIKRIVKEKRGPLGLVGHLLFGRKNDNATRYAKN